MRVVKANSMRGLAFGGIEPDNKEDISMNARFRVIKA